jgi:hypothetical protein
VNTYRKNAITAGVLLLLGFSGILAKVFYGDNLTEANFLAGMAPEHVKIMAGAFTVLFMEMCCIGIAIALYPVLKKHSEGLAMGAVGFRTAGAIASMFSPVFVIMALNLSQGFAANGGDAALYTAQGAALLAGHNWLGSAVAVMGWAIGAGMYHWVFFKSGLIPRWLALWGLIGVPFTVAVAVLTAFQVTTPDMALDTFLNIPLGLQEIPLALWLIVKGFNPKTLVAVVIK